MFESSIIVLGVLFINIVICELLVQKTWLRHIGTATLVIIVSAITANIGIIPSSTQPPKLYDHIFGYVAPLAIFFLLLECNFKTIKSVGFPLLILFLIGSLGTVLGVVVGGYIIGGPTYLGEFYPQIAGMFAGTYTGGSINFNAVALEYDINKEGNLYAGAVAIDNIWTAIWMIATILLPSYLGKLIPRKKQLSSVEQDEHTKSGDDKEEVDPMQLSIIAAFGIISFGLSEMFSSLLAERGFNLPSILILTTLSLGLAQIPLIRTIKGSRVLGILGIYLFLAVIGAYCDFSTLPQMGSMAFHLLLFVGLVVLIHGLTLFGLGSLFKQDWDLISIASQANVGGSGSALALARSLNRPDLLLPAILLGTVGNALGTYLAFMVVHFYL